MFNIEGFLERFRSFTPPNNVIREAVIGILKKETGVLVDKKHISVVNNIVYVKTKPIIKNEVFIKKQEILKELREKFHNQAPLDIK